MAASASKSCGTLASGRASSRRDCFWCIGLKALVGWGGVGGSGWGGVGGRVAVGVGVAWAWSGEGGMRVGLVWFGLVSGCNGVDGCDPGGAPPPLALGRAGATGPGRPLAPSGPKQPPAPHLLRQGAPRARHGLAHARQVVRQHDAVGGEVRRDEAVHDHQRALRVRSAGFSRRARAREGARDPGRRWAGGAGARLAGFSRVDRQGAVPAPLKPGPFPLPTPNSPPTLRSPPLARGLPGVRSVRGIAPSSYPRRSSALRADTTAADMAATAASPEAATSAAP